MPGGIEKATRVGTTTTQQQQKQQHGREGANHHKHRIESPARHNHTDTRHTQLQLAINSPLADYGWLDIGGWRDCLHEGEEEEEDELDVAMRAPLRLYPSAGEYVASAISYRALSFSASDSNLLFASGYSISSNFIAHISRGG